MVLEDAADEIEVDGTSEPSEQFVERKSGQEAYLDVCILNGTWPGRGRIAV